MQRPQHSVKPLGPQLLELERSGELRRLAAEAWAEQQREWLEMFGGRPPRQPEEFALTRRQLDEREG
jgi:hypothetical protein